MQSNRGQDTKPELALRSAAHALGLRYRVSARPLPQLRRTADMVFSSAQVAVFLDGCFWHGCAEHHTVAATNATFWRRSSPTGHGIVTPTAGSPMQVGPVSECGNTRTHMWLLSKSARSWTSDEPPTDVGTAAPHDGREGGGGEAIRRAATVAAVLDGDLPTRMQPTATARWCRGM